MKIHLWESTGKKGILRLDNEPILWRMVNAIKELKTESDNIKDKIGALESIKADQATFKAQLEELSEFKKLVLKLQYEKTLANRR